METVSQTREKFPAPEAAGRLVGTMLVEAHCPIETRVLSTIRALVTAVATDAGFSEEEVERIELAVDEACTNVVRHAYKHIGVSPDLPPERRRTPSTDKPCEVHLKLFVTADYLKIMITDHGIGMRGAPPGVSSIEEYLERRGVGGLGNYIIRNFMDEVEYDSPGGNGTTLTMTKYLPHAAGR